MTSTLITTITDKDVLFVSTKNRDYIRNNQEIDLLHEYSRSTKVIAYSNTNYFLRVLNVYFHLFPLLITNKFDVLFLGFSPQLLFFIFPFISKKKTVVMDFFISVYDTLVDDRKKVTANSRLAKIFHWLDSITIHKATLVISDTNAHASYFSSEFNYPRNKIETLYITADTSIYQKQPNAASKDSTCLNVIYFGSILPVQGVEVILETMKLLASESKIKFTIIGPLKKKYSIQTEEFPNTTFIKWVSQEELAKQLTSSDLGLAGHFSATVGKANRTIAGKTYIYKAMNIPVILGESDANRERFTSDNQLNYFVERGNPYDLAELIHSLYKNMILCE